jgi:hypothetical protein
MWQGDEARPPAANSCTKTMPLNTWVTYFQLGSVSTLDFRCFVDVLVFQSTMKSVRLGQTLGRSLFQQRCYSIVHDVPQNASALSQSPLPTPPQQTSSLLDQAASATGPRSNWTKDEITEIHQTPLMELAFAAVCDRPNILHLPHSQFPRAIPNCQH